MGDRVQRVSGWAVRSGTPTWSYVWSYQDFLTGRGYDDKGELYLAIAKERRSGIDPVAAEGLGEPHG